MAEATASLASAAPLPRAAADVPWRRSALEGDENGGGTPALGPKEEEEEEEEEEEVIPIESLEELVVVDLFPGMALLDERGYM